jgi:hypothetical protein
MIGTRRLSFVGFAGKQRNPYGYRRDDQGNNRTSGVGEIPDSCSARDAAGVPPLRFHDLRHTYGSCSSPAASF